MKRGFLERHEDVSGVSGTGKVAELAISSDGRVAIFWPEPNDSVAVWPNLDKVRETHGHGGKTEIVILDEDNEDAPHCNQCHEAAQATIHVPCMEHENICPGCVAGWIANE